MFWSKPVSIPPFFHLAHGKNSSVGELTLIYGFGAIVGTSLLYFADKESKQRPLNEKPLKTWQKVLLFLAGFDAAAGVIACLTKSTSNFYAEKGKLFGIGLIGIHFIHPLFVYFAFKKEEIELADNELIDDRNEASTSTTDDGNKANKPAIGRRRSQIEKFGIEVDNDCLKEFLLKCYLFQLAASSFNVFLWGNDKFKHTNQLIGILSMLIGYFGLQFEYFTDYIDRKTIHYFMHVYFTETIFSLSVDHYNAYKSQSQ